MRFLVLLLITTNCFAAKNTAVCEHLQAKMDFHRERLSRYKHPESVKWERTRLVQAQNEYVAKGCRP